MAVDQNDLLIFKMRKPEPGDKDKKPEANAPATQAPPVQQAVQQPAQQQAAPQQRPIVPQPIQQPVQQQPQAQPQAAQVQPQQIKPQPAPVQQPAQQSAPSPRTVQGKKGIAMPQIKLPDVNGEVKRGMEELRGIVKKQGYAKQAVQGTGQKEPEAKAPIAQPPLAGQAPAVTPGSPQQETGELHILLKIKGVVPAPVPGQQTQTAQQPAAAQVPAAQQAGQQQPTMQQPQPAAQTQPQPAPQQSQVTMPSQQPVRAQMQQVRPGFGSGVHAAETRVKRDILEVAIEASGGTATVSRGRSPTVNMERDYGSKEARKIAAQMPCENHPWRSAFAICNICKKAYCYEDVVEQGDRYYCLDDIETAPKTARTIGFVKYTNLVYVSALLFFCVMGAFIYYLNPVLSHMLLLVQTLGLGKFIDTGLNIQTVGALVGFVLGGFCCVAAITILIGESNSLKMGVAASIMAMALFGYQYESTLVGYYGILAGIAFGAFVTLMYSRIYVEPYGEEADRALGINHMLMSARNAF